MNELSINPAVSHHKSGLIYVNLGQPRSQAVRPLPRVCQQKISKATLRFFYCHRSYSGRISHDSTRAGPESNFVTLHTHTIVLLLFWNLSGTTRVSRYQKGKTSKGKTNLDLLEQETVSGSGIFMHVCTSSQTTTPTSHHSVFYRLDALPAAQPTASHFVYK